MKQYTINGKEEFCFLVKKGSKNDIVIPVSRLSAVDIRRIVEMEKKGGELLRVMRDTTLSNGVNALKLYESFLMTISNEKPEEKKTESVEPSNTDDEDDAKQNDEDEQPKPKRRGRPPKKK